MLSLQENGLLIERRRNILERVNNMIAMMGGGWLLVGPQPRRERALGLNEKEVCCMNWKLAVGIVLIVLGGAALAFNGVTWYSRKPIIRIATVHMDVTVKHKLFAEPMVAGLALVAGIVLVVLSRKSPRG